MKILAIETSGATFSIALSENGSLVSELFWHAGLSHSERLIPAIKWLVGQAAWKQEELEKIAVSTGPGSFTGIRVGLTCARTMAQGLRVPLVGMDSLALLKAAVPAGDRLIYPAIDALRDEVYVYGAKNKSIEIHAVEKVCADLKKTGKDILLVGNAGEKYGAEIRKALKRKVVFAGDNLNFPRAGVLAIAAFQKEGTGYQLVQPLYIRRSWAEERQG
jgi:tRNA threonylcarbamoyladenosine biosynthesis protein TsaB